MDLFDKCRAILERIDRAQQRALRKRARELSKKICREYGITPQKGEIVFRSGVY